MSATARLARVGIPARNWAGVADWVRDHYCWERQRTGRCPHPACQKAAELEEGALAKDRGEEGLDVKALRKFVCRKKCRNAECNHKGCAGADDILVWLDEQNQQVAA